jgi:hypothetical protein
LKAVIEGKFPFLADFLKIRCEKLGYCPEIQSCGKCPTKKGEGVK